MWTAGSIDPLLGVSEEESRDLLGPVVQLLEGWEYRYEFDFADGVASLTTDRPEVFQSDTPHGRTGRVRPASYTGTLPVRVFGDEVELGQFEIEVRSRKLNYLTEYRWMLRDIADRMAEVIMDRFAVSQQHFEMDDTRDAVTLYQRFAFLRSLIQAEEFQAALTEVVSRPHVAWVDLDEPIRPGRGLHAGSHTLRQLARPGARTAWPRGRIPTLPVIVDRRRTHTSTDTAANRFVKFALEHWRAILSEIADVLQQDPQGAAARRGASEVEEVMRDLDAVLGAELFREIGDLRRFPADDQVLQKREGYRDIYRAYIQFEVAARLSWQGGVDVYGAGQRDVATLYEYWAFFALAGLLSDILDVPFDLTHLIEVTHHGLNLGLKRGRRRVLSGMVRRLERTLRVELWFNRTFAVQSGKEGAWTRSMRPDYSVVLSPGPGEAASFEPVVLHFDAKYRVTLLEELFGTGSDRPEDPLDREDEGPTVLSGTALRTDLLKMHAYRDAIRRSVGAYVVYPGSENETFREYHEILPGLGLSRFVHRRQAPRRGRAV